MGRDKGLIELIEDISKMDNDVLRNAFLLSLANAAGDESKAPSVLAVVSTEYPAITDKDCEAMIRSFTNVYSQVGTLMY